MDRAEIVESVIRQQGFGEAQQAVLHNDGPETEIGLPARVGAHLSHGDGLTDEQRSGV